MLSVAHVSLNQALTYFTKDNYYSHEQGIEASSWWGRSADRMGLSGRVYAETFANLLAGKSADGREELVSRKSKAKGHGKRAGVDMTFSAPKSVTIVGLFDERVALAHQQAVNQALKVVEQEAAFVRRGKARKVEAAGNLLVAQFHHDVSRQVDPQQHPDPQMHTHCVAMNMVETVGDDGQSKHLALYNDGIFNNSKLFGMVYQNALAQLVSSAAQGVQFGLEPAEGLNTRSHSASGTGAKALS